MKKAFDQTVRDIKREVNKKVLKVPGVEQKILDATSNEPWGPHGQLLADLAQATRNYHEYQMIMNVIWKRINDIGKNWRHVYKALTVLEYLVAHGSERVIDEIREHAYQISTLSNFQYIDSSGRDQGNNVRRKSQVLVALVNDKERIQEAREKALANKDKFRSSFSTGGTYGRGGYGDRYADDRYTGRDEDRNGYGREKDWGYGDDDKYVRGRDSYSRDGDRYGQDSDERFGRHNYRDDNYIGRNRSDDYQFGTRSRSFDKDSSFENDARSPGQLESKPSDKSLVAPPSYEETTVVSENHENNGSSRIGIEATKPTPKASSLPAPKVSSPVRVDQGGGTSMAGTTMVYAHKDTDGFDEFDPRSSVVAPHAVTSPDMDFFGSSDEPLGSLALVPVSSATLESQGPSHSGFEVLFDVPSGTSNVSNEASLNPFGDSPFKAVPQASFPAQPSNVTSSSSYSAPPKIETTQNYDFDGSLGGLSYNSSIPSGSSPPFLAADVPAAHGIDVPTAHGIGDILNTSIPQTGFSPIVSSQGLQAATAAPPNLQQAAPFASPANRPLAFTQSGPSSFTPQPGPSSLISFEPVPTSKPQPAKEKFETKSTVWTDTLNRGLVNLNISGTKINPLADIGIDFESINRTEKIKEKKSSAASTTSTSAAMGKAMGVGSSIGRAGANAMARPNPTVGPSTGVYGAGINPLAMGMALNLGPGHDAMGQPRMAGAALGGPSYNYPAATSIGGGGYSAQYPYGGGYR